MLVLVLLLLVLLLLLLARLKRRGFSLSFGLVSLVEEEEEEEEEAREEQASSSRAMRNWRPTLERGFTRVRPVLTEEEESFLPGKM